MARFPTHEEERVFFFGTIIGARVRVLLQALQYQGSRGWRFLFILGCHCPDLLGLTEPPITCPAPAQYRKPLHFARSDAQDALQGFSGPLIDAEFIEHEGVVEPGRRHFPFSNFLLQSWHTKR